LKGGSAEPVGSLAERHLSSYVQVRYMQTCSRGRTTAARFISATQERLPVSLGAAWKIDAKKGADRIIQERVYTDERYTYHSLFIIPGYANHLLAATALPCS
jgi:hypothetical protein